MKQYVLPAGGWGRLIDGAVVERVSEVERRARILEAAALEIEVRGWCQEPEGAISETAKGPRCLLGGILNVIGYGHRDDLERDWERAGAAFGDDVTFIHLYRFNDKTVRTAAEVTFLLRWRAEEIRDGWDNARIPKGSLADA